MSEMKKKQQPQHNGTCLICKETVAKRVAKRHVLKCRKEHPLPEGKRASEIFTLAVTAPDFPEYFLYVEMAGSKKLSDLDDFLRDIWLECCGHLSMFVVDGREYHRHVEADFDEDLADMKVKLGEILQPDMVFGHEYDFGSTTYLELQVVDVRETREAAPAKPVLLLRNEPPQWKCVGCGKPATRVSCGDFGADADSVCCDGCSIPDMDDCGALPLVNSPRTGVCGYEG